MRTGNNRFRKREVTLGLSNGSYVQIKSGLPAEERIKVQTLQGKTGP